MKKAIFQLPMALVLLASCTQGQEEKPGEVEVFAAIAPGEKVTVLGTEPFWSATIDGAKMLYSTSDNIEGENIAVERFAGNGGLGISGVLRGDQLQLAITPGECSDGMSDRTYPYTATLAIGASTLQGCAYTDRQPFEGEEAP